MRTVSCLRLECCNYEVRPRSVRPRARDPLHLAELIETGVEEDAFLLGRKSKAGANATFVMRLFAHVVVLYAALTFRYVWACTAIL